jgi:hypothetical protein
MAATAMIDRRQPVQRLGVQRGKRPNGVLDSDVLPIAPDADVKDDQPD